jgi:hypothetical protein
MVVVVVVRRSRLALAGHIVAEGELHSQLQADCIAEVEELHSLELEIGHRKVAAGIVPEAVGHRVAVAEGMFAARIVPVAGRHNLAVEGDMIVEGIGLEEVGHKQAVVEEDIVHKEVAENLFIVSASPFPLYRI